MVTARSPYFFMQLLVKFSELLNFGEKNKHIQNMKAKIFLLLALATITMQLQAQTMSMKTLTKENAQACYAVFREIFTDASCSELKLPYSAMTDEELTTYFREFPQELIDIAIKVKNNAWAPREKEFRIAEYEPYGNTYSWSTLLKTNPYSYLQRPTGIVATTGDRLLIFVGDELPSGMMLKLLEVKDNQPTTDVYVYESEKFLAKGLNVINVTQEDAMLFIGYAASTDTTATSKRLTDYGNVKVHIEGGKVNGYFDVRRHNDEDWRDMLANHFKHYSVQVRGERVIFQMAKEDIASVCPNTITDAIGWWDRCVQWQHELMGVDKYYDRWNTLMMARSGHDNSYMYATHYYTYYEHSTLKDILPWATVYANPGQMWGPAHEIGHMNQGAINIVSCTEVSNNLFSNVQIHRAGKSTTRGVGVAECIKDFGNSVPFPLRENVIGKSRMFFQLYLYFHAAKKDETFYPRLFDALRHDPLIKGSETYAKDDQLKFAEKCCEIAQMDLSEFFDAWGFFEPMTNAVVGDYGTFNVNLTMEEAEASRARMQQYEKKGGHLMFIEDRIKPSKRTDGVDGYRIDFNEEFVVGKMGDFGQWEDYIDESVKAEGYYYSLIGNTVYIKEEEGAKGALGFKVHDANTGELLAFSNTLNVTIPAYANKERIIVVAAQADGIDKELMNVMDSDDEEMQRLALEVDLATVRKIVKGATKDGKKIGCFYTESVTELNELYQKALAAFNSNDTSLHSYKEWRALLNDELEELRSAPYARARLLELDVYEMSNAGEAGYMLCNDRMGMKGTYEYGAEGTYWLVENAGEKDCFYLKNKDGKYVNDVTLGLGAMCSGSSNENAVKFYVHYNDNGNTYFTTKEEGMYLAMNSEHMVIGDNKLRDNGLWIIRRVEDNTAVIEIGEEEDAGPVFDLQGRKVENPGKGIYIINGKLKINR